MYIQCKNNRCEHCFEGLCEINITGEYIVILDENGQCELFLEGINQEYRES